MLKFFLSSIRGIFVGLFYSLNALFFSILVFLFALLQWIFPIPSWRRFCHRLMNNCPVYWIDIWSAFEKLVFKIEWDITGIENLKHDDWYLLICNHQTWTDIPVLQQIFNRKIPILKFFMKKQLLWSLPLMGWACWLLDYPYMERYTKEFIAKHPELKGKDMETTRKVCEKFKNIPTSIFTFLEGTRFTVEKHQRQHSPFKYLLRPRAGGVAFALGAMGDYFHKILDVTIIYPEKTPTFWDYFCGRVKKIIVRVNVLPVNKELIGDYENDRYFRTQIQQWANMIWCEKDKLIEKTIASSHGLTAGP